MKTLDCVKSVIDGLDDLVSFSFIYLRSTNLDLPEREKKLGCA